MSERFLVTGAFGCIGAWTVKRLIDEGLPVWTYDLPGNPHRMRLIMDEETLARVNFVNGDITDPNLFEKTVVDNGITHIIHLAALQVPFVRADPILGARVNVVGTTIVFETAKQHAQQVQGLTYASSTGVYGSADEYPPGPLAHNAPLKPPTLYGVYKQANEGTAQIYWKEYGLSSIGLRPYVVYGPGRDQGWTSTPTKAMVAAVVGRKYHINFGGSIVFQFANDAAAVFIRAARTPSEGAAVYNLGGTTATMAEVVAAIEAAIPTSAGQITFEPTALPGPSGIDSSALKTALGQFHWTSLAEGVRQTIDCFQAAVSANKLDVEKILV